MQRLQEYEGQNRTPNSINLQPQLANRQKPKVSPNVPVLFYFVTSDMLVQFML
jgi:hypothetical protein